MNNKQTSAGVKQRPSPYPRPNNPGQLSKKPPITVVASRLNKQPASPGISTPPPVEHVPVNDLVQAARKAFSDKDFVSALHLLTRALNVAPKDINLLDSRAACCEKLGRFNDALTDAKTMIQLYPQSPKVGSISGPVKANTSNREKETLTLTFSHGVLVGILACRKDPATATKLQIMHTDLCGRSRAL